MKKSIAEIQSAIKEGMLDLLIEKGTVSGKVYVSADDAEGTPIKSMHFKDGKIVKVHTLAYTLEGAAYYGDTEVKRDFYFYDKDGSVLLFKHKDDHFIISCL